MRIALVDPPSFTPPYDHGLASALASRGHDVHLLTSPFLRGPTPVPDRYRRHEVFLPLSGRLFRRAPNARLRLLVKGAEYVPSARRLVRLADALAPDVVHLQWLAMPRYDVRWVRRLVGSYPTVLTAHDVLPRLRRNVSAWGEVLRAVDHVVVHSDAAATQLTAAVAGERITRIPHPVFVAPPAHQPTAPSGQTLLSFGLIRSYKGNDVLIRALPALARALPDVRLVVAGDPLEPVEPLQRLADELGVAGRIDWRLRFFSADEIPALMESAAAVVLPYRAIERFDSSGVLATALGHGRPAIVSDVGSLGDTVRRFDAGLVVPPEDAGALAQACIRLLGDREALAAAFRGTAAARRALTWESSAEEHERVYEAVAAGRDRTQANLRGAA
jgi:glycosyltransferase involved in cell wall biosynthesis